MAKSYFEKLKDPRWQKKRLEAMQYRDFRCEICGDGESTLNVHHKQYFKGREPWEYDIQQLAVLCEVCHQSTHENEDALNFVCSFLPMDGPNCRDSTACLLSAIAGVCIPEPFSYPDQVSFLGGTLARELFIERYSRLDDIKTIEKASLLFKDEMFEILLAFAKSKVG